MTRISSISVFIFCVVPTFLYTAHAQSAACSLKPETGLCRAAIPRWFYDPVAKKCSTFIWGGCGGVVPFQTELDCILGACNPCTQIPATGPCEALFTKYFFNNKRGKCQPFTWGGCQGSVPFQTKRECNRARCKPTVLPTPKPLPLEKRCALQPNAGPCKARKRRWFWNSSEMKCHSFIWGGCFGTVPFKSKPMCEKAKCKQSKCTLVGEPGPCDGDFTRWQYNTETDMCEPFQWGGCDGVVPFETKEECIRSGCIKNRCKLKPEGGPCKASIERYFFNPETGMCDTFTWGGCLGVVPFVTADECNKASCEVDKCLLTPDPGPCRGSFPRWFFNQETGMCEKFIYGGCQGRVPFKTEDACNDEGCKADPCKLTPDAGPCRGSFPRYFWNPDTMACEKFSYGGCRGRVPFITVADCEKAMCKW